MYSSEQLRAVAHQHRANAESCHDRKVGAQYVKLAEAYESLADSKDRLRALADEVPQVELALPDGGFGRTLDAIHDFHRLRGIENWRGRRQRRDEQKYMRWCFASVIDADDFAQQFGGTRIQPDVDERSAVRPR